MIKIGTICSGIGAPEKALANLGIAFTTEYFCEFDKFAAQSYCAIHGESEKKNLGDLTKVDIDNLPTNLDLIIGGTPCQDFSVAGKRAGGTAEQNTRSSLMWNFVEIIRQTFPKVVLWENVPGCVTKGRMQANYTKFITALNDLDYVVYADILNAKHFGVPQNRDRVFVLAIRRICHPLWELDTAPVTVIDATPKFKKPTGYDCGIRLKDVLEFDVAEKYFLSDKIIQGFLNKKSNFKAKFKPKTREDIASALTARMHKMAITDNYIAENEIIEITENQPQSTRVYSPEGLSVALSAQGGGAGAKTGLYLVPHGYRKGGYVETDTAPTITGSKYQFNNLVFKGDRIRRLTPSECFRLMGFSDDDVQKCQAEGISDSQLYKQAGNSIVVNVLMAIFGELYGVAWQEKVYGARWTTPEERYLELPLFKNAKGGEPC